MREQEMTTEQLLEAYIWGVEPDNVVEIDAELRNRGIDPKQVAENVQAFCRDVAAKGSVSPFPVTSRYEGKCAISGQPIKKGDKVMYFKDGKRGKKCVIKSVWESLKEQLESGDYTPSDSGDDLAQTLARSIEKHLNIKPGIDEAAVERVVTRIMGDIKPTKLEIKMPDGNSIKCDDQHRQFPDLMRLIACRMNVYLVGPAGSGKTSAAHSAADTCSLKFSSISVGPQTSQYQIMGHVGPDGKYHSTQFRERFEQGGVMLLDEIDTANGGVLTVINSALANSYCAFPDGMVKKHKDFVCIAAGNTYGSGANRVYVGRTQLDGATIDRFKFMEWDYDEKAELRWSSVPSWTKYVQKLRRAAEQEQIRHVISPRASIDGGTMIQAGFTVDEVMNQAVWKGLAEDSKRRILAIAGEYINA